jgi:hypothetical protein
MPKQTWARDPEIAGNADTPSHSTTPGDAQPYADTDRFGTPQKGETASIMSPQNKVADPVWGVQAPAGGPVTNTPPAPDIPVTKGE